MQELSKLFGSVEKVKLIRFFLANKDGYFDMEEIEEKLSANTPLKKEKLREELSDLEKANLIKRSKEKYDVQIETNNKVKNDIREYLCFSVNKNFRFLKALENFVFDFQNADLDVLTEKFKTIGRTKLFLVGGVFTGDEKAKADILYVGESLKTKVAEKIVNEIEVETGKKLNILILDIEEFEYRYKMYDRVLRDILKSDSSVLINKISYLHF